MFNSIKKNLRIRKATKRLNSSSLSIYDAVDDGNGELYIVYRYDMGLVKDSSISSFSIRKTQVKALVTVTIGLLALTWKSARQ